MSLADKPRPLLVEDLKKYKKKPTVLDETAACPESCEWKNHQGTITSILPYGNRGMITASSEGKFIYWSPQSEIIREWTGDCKKLLIVEDLLFCASHGNFGTLPGYVRVFDLKNFCWRYQLNGHELYLTEMDICGSKLITASADKTVRLWHVPKIAVALASASAERPAALQEITSSATLRTHCEPVEKLLVYNGMLFTGSGDKSIISWNPGEGWELERMFIGHTGAITALYGMQDQIFSAAADNTIRQWDMYSGKLLATLRTKYPIHGLAGHRGLLFAWTGGPKFYVMCIDLKNCTISKLKGFNKKVTAVKFSEECVYIACAASYVLQWDIELRRCIARYKCTESKNGVTALHVRDEFLFAGSDQRLFRFTLINDDHVRNLRKLSKGRTGSKGHDTISKIPISTSGSSSERPLSERTGSSGGSSGSPLNRSTSGSDARMSMLGRPSDIIYGADKHGLPCVCFASTERLIEEATSDQGPSDNIMLAHLLLTYRYYLSPQSMWAKLQERYLATSSQIGQVRVCALLRKWLASQPADFDPELLKSMEAFFRAKLNQKDVASSVIQAVLRGITEAPSSSRRAFSASPDQERPPPQIAEHAFDAQNITRCPPFEFARQLTLRDFRMFSAIAYSEFLNLSGSRVHMGRSNLDLMIDTLAQLTRWAIGVILNPTSTTAHRTEWLSWTISLAAELVSVHNAASAAAIFSALQSVQIQNLHLAWADITPRTRKLWDHLAELFALPRQQLRARLSENQPPAIPHIVLFCTEIELAENAEPIFEKDLVNFLRCRNIASLLMEIQQFQTIPFAFTPVHSIQEYLSALPQFTDTDIADLAHALLPLDSDFLRRQSISPTGFLATPPRLVLSSSDAQLSSTWRAREQSPSASGSFPSQATAFSQTLNNFVSSYWRTWLPEAIPRTWSLPVNPLNLSSSDDFQLVDSDGTVVIFLSRLLASPLEIWLLNRVLPFYDARSPKRAVYFCLHATDRDQQTAQQLGVQLVVLPNDMKKPPVFRSPRLNSSNPHFAPVPPLQSMPTPRSGPSSPTQKQPSPGTLSPQPVKRSASPQPSPRLAIGPQSPHRSASPQPSPRPLTPSFAPSQFNTWEDFFKTCGLDREKLTEIAPILEANGVQPQTLGQLNEKQLKSFGIKLGPLLKMQKVIAAMKHE